MPINPNVTFAYDGINNNPNIQNQTYVAPILPNSKLNYSSSDCAENEANYMAKLMAESFQISGGPVNIFSLLGVHNQGSTISQSGNGYPLSSGQPADSNLSDAFNVNDESWTSIQTGNDVVKYSYIGYDFGTKKTFNGNQERYIPSEPNRVKVATIKIKQSSVLTKRVAQVRVEVQDGIQDSFEWKQIDIINIPLTNDLVSIRVNSNASYNKWRIRPSLFLGDVNDSWEVIELHFLESTQLSLDEIEDFVLLENRDRSYNRTSTLLKCSYDLLDVQSELARFGISLPQTYIFTCSFISMVTALGRPIIVGDVVEVPGEIQYDMNLKPVRKWLEVTDTGWSTEGYTYNWKPNLFRFYAQPIMPSVEHKDLLGLPGEKLKDEDVLSGILENDLAQKTSEYIKQMSKDILPQTGIDTSFIQSSNDTHDGTRDGRGYMIEDAIPQDGKDFTMGDTLPTKDIILDGHYHRQTYLSLPVHLRPPDRLLKYDISIDRWKVIEINTRVTPKSYKANMSKVLNSPNSVDLDYRL